MSLSDLPDENNPGQYAIENMAIVTPDGDELVALGDSLEPAGSPFLDLEVGESVVVATYETAGDITMIEVVGSDKMDRIAAECLDALLDDRLTRNPA